MLLACCCQAARRRAITELLFFASVGNLQQVQHIVKKWNLDVSSIPSSLSAGMDPARLDWYSAL